MKLVNYHSFPLDIYAAAVIFWSILELEIPYQTEIKNGEFESIRTLVKDDYRLQFERTPLKVRKVIEKCWSKDPTARPTVNQLRLMFEQFKIEQMKEKGKERKNERKLKQKAKKQIPREQEIGKEDEQVVEEDEEEIQLVKKDKATPAPPKKASKGGKQVVYEDEEPVKKGKAVPAPSKKAGKKDKKSKGKHVEEPEEEQVEEEYQDEDN